MLKYKRKRMRINTSLKSLIILCMVNFSLQADVEVSAADLNYYTESYPPANYIENGQLVGVSVETLKLIWQVLGVPEQKIQLVPWARGYTNTLHNKNSVLFTMSRTADRETLFKWVGPIYSAKHVLLARADFQHQIVTIEDAYRYPVAAIRNDISEIILKEAGFPAKNIAPLTSLQQALLLLVNGRLDLIIITQSSLNQLLIENHLSREQFQTVITVNEKSNYFAFNKNTPEKLIKQFQMAFDQIAGQRIALKKKYGLAL